MYKSLLIATVIIFSSIATADPYVTTKHEFKYKDSDYSKTINHIRFGNSWTTPNKFKLHAEIGIAESIDDGENWFSGNAGKSYQFGFQKDLTSSFAIKGKYEGFEQSDDVNSSKFEIITKYKF